MFLSITFWFAFLLVMGSQKRFLAYYLNKSMSESTLLARYSARSRCIQQCSREWHCLLEVSGSSSRELWFCTWQQQSNAKEPGAAADHTLHCIKLTEQSAASRTRAWSSSLHWAGEQGMVCLLTSRLVTYQLPPRQHISSWSSPGRKVWRERW